MEQQTKAPGACVEQCAVTQHVGLVYHLARSVMRNRRVAVELDELVSAGTLGLIEALEGFDAARGLAFTTYAAPRIRGAMLDELRRLDHVPRSVRRRARAVAAARDALTSELGGAPNTGQVATRLGIEREALWRWLSDHEATHTLPLHSAGTPDAGAASIDSVLGAAPGCDVDEALTREQELLALRDAIRALGSRERTILALYYFEELRLHEIAELLSVTESRVSQIRTQVVARLREQLARLRAPHAIQPPKTMPRRPIPAVALR